MSQYLCITVRFLDQTFHGRRDGGQPEWPPSPLRLFQALVAAASLRFRGEAAIDRPGQALKWLEQQPAPTIITPRTRQGQTYRLYCPDNIADRVAASWSRGGDASIADSRTEKDVRPTHLLDADAVHYLWPIDDRDRSFVTAMQQIAHSVTHVGWGMDQVVADAREISAAELSELIGIRWMPRASIGALGLRCPQQGTLDALQHRFARFLRRVDRDERGEEFFNPVPALSSFRLVGYHNSEDASSESPHVVFQLQGDENLRPFSYPQEKLIHIAGMARHLAIEALRRSPPRGANKDWIESFVAGHVNSGDEHHRQLSYVPLPSIGHRHADQAIRRVMVMAPAGCDSVLQHLARLLSGQQLQPTEQTRMRNRPVLVHVRGDKVARQYTDKSTAWASVTPVILPGHNDRSPAKTRKLIEKALHQSGITQVCDFDWSPFSRFSKSLSAHKYDRDKRPAGYIRPDHLLTQTAVHLTLTFPRPVSGPLVIGAGRHCGFGVMAVDRTV